MTGATLHDYWNSSPSKDEADGYLVVNQADMTPGLAKPRIDPGVRDFITGLIRGNFMDMGKKFALHSWEGPWVLAMEVLEVTIWDRRHSGSKAAPIQLRWTPTTHGKCTFSCLPKPPRGGNIMTLGTLSPKP